MIVKNIVFFVFLGGLTKADIKKMLTKTVQKFKTKYCADSVEWCPLTDNENLLLVGNYQLVENTSATDTQVRLLTMLFQNKNVLFLFIIVISIINVPLKCL